MGRADRPPTSLLHGSRLFPRKETTGPSPTGNTPATTLQQTDGERGEGRGIVGVLPLWGRCGDDTLPLCPDRSRGGTQASPEIGRTTGTEEGSKVDPSGSGSSRSAGGGDALSSYTADHLMVPARGPREGSGNPPHERGKAPSGKESLPTSPTAHKVSTRRTVVGPTVPNGLGRGRQRYC